MKRMWYALIALAFALLALPCHAAILLCLVLAVPDGDSLRMKCEERVKPISVRLIEVDAPEVKHSGFVRIAQQPYGKEAQQSLSALCYGKQATVHTYGLDKYRRTLAHVDCGTGDVNSIQVATGSAWSFMPKRGSHIPALQKAAQDQKAGLWALPDPIPPSTWRKK